MDFLDLAKPKIEYYKSGSYREFDDNSAPQYFEYADVNTDNRQFGNVVRNITTSDRQISIRTVWDCGWRVNGIVITQDGAKWSITAISDDCKNNPNLMFFTHNPGAEYTLTLQQVDNPLKMR